MLVKIIIASILAVVSLVSAAPADKKIHDTGPLVFFGEQTASHQADASAHPFHEHVKKGIKIDSDVKMGCKPVDEKYGPAPSVEDCQGVVDSFRKLTPNTIDVKLVEGCVQEIVGSCTGLVCPQRLGESTIAGTDAADLMAAHVLNPCISKGVRGWYIDGFGTGIGVYLV
ncbi:hypothetical protein F5Y15DRAFT_419207 [Xylariaceae sp. FL0016]|nr:hypothetical protein F5Y15DRAFT_419207 [Xylariaceae sp. FL0016]